MTSQIDPTKPTAGVATTESVRANFLHAKNEIEAEQLVGAAAATAAAAAQSTADQAAALNAASLSLKIEVRNTTGATLLKGQAVYISGATGQIPTVSLAKADSDATSSKTLGLMAADLANNTNGYAHLRGQLTGLDTSAFADGDLVWLSSTTAGALTATRPPAPAHAVYCGVVAYSHATQGKLNVNIINGYELEELHNVLISSLANKDFLRYESSTGLWKNVSESVALAPTNVGGDAFSAYLPTANQNVSSSVTTKVTLSAEEFDVNNKFDATTNYRFQPTVAGYYSINGTTSCQANGTSLTGATSALYKNGVAHKAGAYYVGPAITAFRSPVSSLVYLNGTTDYIELFVNIIGTSPYLNFGANQTYLSGSLIQKA